MEELPVEIWLLVTEFFTDEDLYHVIGVNKFFFDLGMNKRYHEVTLDMGDGKIRAWLAHVSEPGIASRIKRLILHINPVNEPRRATNQGNTGSLRSALRNVLHIPSKLRSSKSSGPPEPMDVKSMVEKLILVLPLMTAVDDFRIVTWAMPSPFDLDPLYHRAWSVFGSTLRRISICANMGGYHSLLKSKPSLPSLETLELEFSDNVFKHDPAELEFLSEEVVPFVNGLCPRIKCLKIRSFAKFDLSALFLNMKPFSCLEQTLIRIPFTPGLRQNPDGLRDLLLRSSSTLKKIAIRLTPMGLFLDPTTETPVEEWLSQLVSDPTCFSKAEALDVCPTNMPNGMRVVSQCISNAHKHLRFLTVRERYLTTEQVVTLSQELTVCEHLTYLRLNIQSLTCGLFDVLARDLPDLRNLWLSVGEHPAPSEAPLNIQTFRQSMEQRKYLDWKLWDLSIWQGGNELDSETMAACARSIPSVQSFWGTGLKT